MGPYGPIGILIALVIVYLWGTLVITIKTRGRVKMTIMGPDHRVETRLVKVGVDGDPHRISPKSGGDYIIEESAVGYERWPSSVPDFMRVTIPCLWYEKDSPDPIRLLQDQPPKASANAIQSMFKEGFLRTMLKDAEENFHQERGKISPQKLTLYATLGAAGLAGLAVYMAYNITNELAAMQATLNALR